MLSGYGSVCWVAGWCRSSGLARPLTSPDPWLVSVGAIFVDSEGVSEAGFMFDAVTKLVAVRREKSSG